MPLADYFHWLLQNKKIPYIQNVCAWVWGGDVFNDAWLPMITLRHTYSQKEIDRVNSSYLVSRHVTAMQMQNNQKSCLFKTNYPYNQSLSQENRHCKWNLIQPWMKLAWEVGNYHISKPGEKYLLKVKGLCGRQGCHPPGWYTKWSLTSSYTVIRGAP